MTIQDLGAIGELLAALATLATLVYLARQIGQNTRAMQTNAADSLATAAQNMMSTLTGTAENAYVFNLGATDYDALAEDQKVQYRYGIVSLLNTSDLMYWNYRKGTLDKELWDRQEVWIASWLSHPIGLELWDGYKTFLTSSFSEYVDLNVRRKADSMRDAVRKYEQHDTEGKGDA